MKKRLFSVLLTLCLVLEHAAFTGFFADSEVRTLNQRNLRSPFQEQRRPESS